METIADQAERIGPGAIEKFHEREGLSREKSVTDIVLEQGNDATYKIDR